MKHVLALLAALAVLLTAGGLAWSSAAGADPPAGSTVVDVRGSRDHGFVIDQYDGTRVHTPTLSEGLAECGEYAHRLDRVRCRTALRVSYRGLARLKWALAYAHSTG
jgi:hypothetical protein